MTRRALIPVTVTERYPSPRTGRMEDWAARSADGAWLISRLEEPGTPWAIEHLSCERIVMLAGSLTKARRAISDGTAMAALERIRAGLLMDELKERRRDGR